MYTPERLCHINPRSPIHIVVYVPGGPLLFVYHKNLVPVWTVGKKDINRAISFIQHLFHIITLKLHIKIIPRTVRDIGAQVIFL